MPNLSVLTLQPTAYVFLTAVTIASHGTFIFKYIGMSVSFHLCYNYIGPGSVTLRTAAATSLGFSPFLPAFYGDVMPGTVAAVLQPRGSLSES